MVRSESALRPSSHAAQSCPLIAPLFFAKRRLDREPPVAPTHAPLRS
jgi:hypothetical protein